MKTANYNWYVFYTRPNAEKVVYNELLNRHYDAFLPLVKTLHRWKNRQRKFVSKVLFRGYVFVRTAEHEIFNIIHIPKIIFCVKCGDRYSVLRDRDVKCLEQMLVLTHDIYKELDFADGERVMVTKGPLTGYEGMLFKRKGKNRFGVLFDDIKQCACIDIDEGSLIKTQ